MVAVMALTSKRADVKFGKFGGLSRCVMESFQEVEASCR
jgi:hypothetical protein